MNPNQPLDENTRRSLEGQAWQELVDEILWNKQIKKHKIKVKDSDTPHRDAKQSAPGTDAE
jgi:hypothetical protein